MTSYGRPGVASLPGHLMLFLGTFLVGLVALLSAAIGTVHPIAVAVAVYGLASSALGALVVARTAPR